MSKEEERCRHCIVDQSVEVNRFLENLASAMFSTGQVGATAIRYVIKWSIVRLDIAYSVTTKRASVARRAAGVVEASRDLEKIEIL